MLLSTFWSDILLSLGLNSFAFSVLPQKLEKESCGIIYFRFLSYSIDILRPLERFTNLSGALQFSMWRQSTNGYAEAATNGNLSVDHSKQEVSTISFKNNKPESTNECRTLAIPQSEDDPEIRKQYRPFILDEEAGNDWVNDLELDAVMEMADRDIQETNERLKVLVLYGSLRRRSVSRVFHHGWPP